MNAFTPDQERRLREIENDDQIYARACFIVEMVKQKNEDSACNPVPSAVKKDLKRAAKLIESLPPAAKDHIQLWINLSFRRFLGLATFQDWGVTTKDSFHDYINIEINDSPDSTSYLDRSFINTSVSKIAYEAFVDALHHGEKYQKSTPLGTLISMIATYFPVKGNLKISTYEDGPFVRYIGVMIEAAELEYNPHYVARKIVDMIDITN